MNRCDRVDTSVRMWKLQFLVLAAALSAPSLASAASLRYEAPARCPSSQRFAEEVAARLGFSPWNGGGTTLRVRITSGKSGYVGSLAPDGSAEGDGRRFVADSCRKVTDLLVTATAIALDRSDERAAARPAPAPRRTAARSAREAKKPAASSQAVVYPAFDETAATWSFAERNNSFQLGVGIVSTAGAFAVLGNVPLGGGHVQGAYARLGGDGGTVQQLHAFYLWPVFYINEGSSFEVPVFAGGGLAYGSYSYTASGEDHDDTAIMPTAAVGTALQFRRFPVEFLSQMTFSPVKHPLSESMIGFNFAIRYVFGRE